MTALRWTPVAVALLAAGCGSGGTYGDSPSPASTVTSAAPARAPGLTVKKTSLGQVVADARGRTLYLFGADRKNVSNCADACAGNWPPAAAPKTLKVGTGLPAKVRAIKRSDGTRQLSYAGHPLYRFAGDGKPGDVKGQGVNAFGGVWSVVAPSGKAIATAQPQPSTGGYSGRGGY